MRLAIINGEFKDKISIFDRGLAYGDGFFETTAWRFIKRKKDCRVEFWNRHLKRIKQTCQFLNIKISNFSQLEKDKKKILTKAHNIGMVEGVLKIIITRGEGGRGYKYEKNMKPNIMFIVSNKTEYPSDFYSNGVKIKISKSPITINNSLAGFKHLNRLDSVLARSEWEDHDVFDSMFIDNYNNIIEGTMSNLFFIKENVLYTPSINICGIKGIMREVVIDKCCEFFDEIKICESSKDFFLEADSIFLTNSLIKILPVKQVESKKFVIDQRVLKIIKKFDDLKFLELK